MEKFTIGKYDYKQDQEYLDYIAKEKKEAHLTIYDDANTISVDEYNTWVEKVAALGNSKADDECRAHNGNLIKEQQIANWQLFGFPTKEAAIAHWAVYK